MMVAKTIQIDLVGQRVGAIYGKAFFAAADGDGKVVEAIEEFDSLLTDVLDRQPALEQLLGNPMIAVDEKLGVIDHIFSGKASPLMLRFLEVLGRKERLGYLRPILKQVHLLENHRKGLLSVDVTTATPLGTEMYDRLLKATGELLSCQVELTADVNPEMIGGVILKIGDTVYDSSVHAELERLRTRMRSRNIDAIEAQRNRYQAENHEM